MFCSRLATPDDLGTLHDMDRICFPTSNPQAVQAQPGELQAAIERGKIVLADWDGQPAGFLHRTVLPQRIIVEALAVLPWFRRLGIARRLLVDVLTPLRDPQQPFRLVETVTSPQNPAMVRLLTSIGFSAGELHHDYFGPGLDRLLFQWYSRPPDDFVMADPEVLSAVLRAGYRVTGLHTASDGPHLRLLVGPPDGFSAGSPGQEPIGIAGQIGVTDQKADSGPPRDTIHQIARTPTTAARPRLQSTAVPLPHTLAGAIDDPPARSKGSECLRNADADWQYFNPVAYWKRNYQDLLPIDRKILAKVSLYFAGLPPLRHQDREIQALDIGTGSNLYPALTMLPLADSITLADYARPNIDWLVTSLSDTDKPWPWQSFWAQVVKHAQQSDRVHDYARDRDVRQELRKRAHPELWSIFDLPERTWDLGTMFFVAESITEDHAEFATACRRFFGALVPEAPFAAAFMTESSGYRIDDRTFPAVQVNRSEIETVLADVVDVDGLQVYEFLPSEEDTVRDQADENSFASMVLALGRVR